MASVKVAVRVRPFNQREKDMGAKLIVQMDGKKTRLLTVKNSKEQNDGSREKYKDFTFDHSYWSYDSTDSHYASQEQVFSDLGLDVIDSAFEGYNACVFAYGQTGSGKTFTMMGSPENQGLIPRICRQLFSRVAAGKESGASYRTEVSYLEIYNERVKDLLATDAGHSLRVREHPKLGPYVQDLSKHLVSDYDDIQECMHRGNLHRTTASTQMNDVSSRSHAIFTITFVQASYLRHNNMPSETASKVHLVDLAGSERADATGATGQRLVEGAHINKSLVTLGSVISALADSAHHAADARTPKGTKKNVFIPYRDSVLTWLLKDSLGGNSKTIMIAAISPADVNYGETLSTLRYANRAKNIINKPTINEDPNVKLIRELREEIDKLRAQIAHNTDPIETEAGVLATLQRKEAQEKVLTEKWTEKWRETQQILQEQKALGLRKSGLGVVLDSDMPHLVGIDDNLLSTGVTLYHLKEGETLIGSEEYNPTPDIVLSGAGVLPLHARVTLQQGVATLHPSQGAQCWLNTVLIDKPAKLSQGCILLLGRTNMFRYNDPAEAAKLRQEGSASVMNLSRLSLLSWSTTDLAASTENLQASDLESESRSERIEAQRAELERSRQQFVLQQQERQRRWQQEREQLLQAQRMLHQEREAMEREYAAACRRLSGDWRALEKGWTHRRRALRARQRELRQRVLRLRALADTHRAHAETEESRVSELKAQLDDKKASFDKYADTALEGLKKLGIESSSPDTSETSTECLLQLLQQCEPATASNIRDIVDRHKKELLELEEELQCRASSVASHRTRVDRLQAELALLHTQQLGLRHALAADLSPPRTGGEAAAVAGVKRSKSELVLRPPTDLHDPPPDDQHDYRLKKMSLSLSLDPLASPNTALNTEDSFHTASCSSPKPFPDTSTPSTDATLATTSTTGAVPDIDELPAPHFRLGPTDADDSDISSADDCRQPRVVEGQSSSSVERSPDERHQRAKYRRKITSEAKAGRRQVTEAEALRAMQRLCSRIAAQKMLVISSLENDCSKEELNRQIAVLQELQKKYVRLEMALQYSFFDNQTHRRPMMVTPIQETPSLTLSESDMHVATDDLTDADRTKNAEKKDKEADNHKENGHIIDPLLNRLKEADVEGSDNVSTSNDELATDRDEPWHPLKDSTLHQQPTDTAPALPDPTITIMTDSDQYIDFNSVVSVPGWVTRGAGAGTHHEYEVRVSLPDCRYLLLRRYRRFRDLYLAMRRLYGPKVRGRYPVPGAPAVAVGGGGPRASAAAGVVPAPSAGGGGARPAQPAAPRATHQGHARRLLAILPEGRVRERQVRHGMMPRGARRTPPAAGRRRTTGRRTGRRPARAGRLPAAAAAAAAALPHQTTRSVAVIHRYD